MRSTQLQNLWKSSPNNNQLKLVSGNYESFCKKAVDNFCMKVDLCEDLESYVMTVCEGMNELIKLGIPKDSIIKHDLALTKILRFGEDIIEYSENKTDLFYIGIFVELKISSYWFKLPFYSVIRELVLIIVKNGKKMPELLKCKIEKLLKTDNYPLYALYFIKGRPPSFKNSA